MQKNFGAQREQIAGASRAVHSRRDIGERVVYISPTLIKGKLYG